MTAANGIKDRLGPQARRPRPAAAGALEGIPPRWWTVLQAREGPVSELLALGDGGRDRGRFRGRAGIGGSLPQGDEELELTQVVLEEGLDQGETGRGEPVGVVEHLD